MIVTDLWNRAMPFIRYRNGDSVKFLNKKCSCGRELPLIKAKGRSNDFLITKNGVVGATYLMYHGIGYVGAGEDDSKFRTGIRAVQYVQKPGYLLEVNLVKNKWCKDEEIISFEKILSKITHGMKIRINFVNDMPKTRKGKRSFIINEDKELLKKWREMK